MHFLVANSTQVHLAVANTTGKSVPNCRTNIDDSHATVKLQAENKHSFLQLLDRTCNIALAHGGIVRFVAEVHLPVANRLVDGLLN
eukprot:scaffold1318_cov388-Prasinococcus_capsulatus_cf.AAC.18